VTTVKGAMHALWLISNCSTERARTQWFEMGLLHPKHHINCAHQHAHARAHLGRKLRGLKAAGQQEVRRHGSHHAGAAGQLVLVAADGQLLGLLELLLWDALGHSLHALHDRVHLQECVVAEAIWHTLGLCLHVRHDDGTHHKGPCPGRYLLQAILGSNRWRDLA